MSHVADATFAAIQAGYVDPRRLELYLARIAIDHGQRALAALRADNLGAFEAHLQAYGRIARGLIESGYWLADADAQVGWGYSGA